MHFKTKEEFEEYKEKAQAELNSWVENNPLPGIGIGRDEHGNVIQITTSSRVGNLARMSEGDPQFVHSVEKTLNSPYPEPENGCKTCAAKGLKRLILGGAKLLKSELGIDAADSDAVQTRKETCLKCEKYNFGVCEECGCFCAAKVKLSTEKCPIGKW